MSVAAHLGIDLDEYDARIRTFIPDYDALLAAAAATLKIATRRRMPLVVDLGIGTGSLSAACLACVAGARIVGIDEDAEILEVARRRVGRPLQTSVHASFDRADIPSCDAVIASLALHHIATSAERRRLFRRIRRALNRGGVLISADCHPAADARLAAAGHDAWLAHLTRTYTPAISHAYLRAWAREDHYTTLSDELAMLQRAGFTVDVRYRSGAFAVIAAVTKS